MSEEEAAPEGAVEQLLRRCADGDRAALAELYDATSPRIYALVLSVVGSPSDAARVTQNVYLEFWADAAHQPLTPLDAFCLDDHPGPPPRPASPPPATAHLSGAPQGSPRRRRGGEKAT